MRPIDADALFDAAFEVWGNEADGGETNLFMEMINHAPTIAPPPNDPLTLEELREMCGEPVYIVSGVFFDYRVINYVDEGEYLGYIQFTDHTIEPIKNYGDTWLAYRRKPEGD